MFSIIMYIADSTQFRRSGSLFICSRDKQLSGMTPESLSHDALRFLVGSHAAVVVEDGAVVFDLADAKYSISGEYNKCLVHLWSSERNAVRRVLDAEVKGATLRLQVQRMGQSRPTRLDICRDRDQRSPAARRTARQAYAPRLRRALGGNFPGWTVVRLSTTMDLERSFGPAYLRGLMRQGQRALAILGVNDEETQATVDGALTCGLLWLEACRWPNRLAAWWRAWCWWCQRAGSDHATAHGTAGSVVGEMAFKRIRSARRYAGADGNCRLR